MRNLLFVTVGCSVPVTSFGEVAFPCRFCICELALSCFAHLRRWLLLDTMRLLLLVDLPLELAVDGSGSAFFVIL